jgi:ubiquinone/menaquinone biosynthesis C-methylase UbiE
MKCITDEMITKLPPSNNTLAIDLACGTGYTTWKLAERTEKKPRGIDNSDGMLDIARNKYGSSSDFIKSDVMHYLQNQPSNSVDIITCSWGMGYFQPHMFIKEIARVLRPQGFVGIIDHSKNSNKNMVKSSLYAFAENPHLLKHMMKSYYLSGSKQLSKLMRKHGINPVHSWDGEKIFYEQDPKRALKRLIQTGAALGGLDFSLNKNHQEMFYDRVAEIIDERCRDKKGIPITYRYYGGIGQLR